MKQHVLSTMCGCVVLLCLFGRAAAQIKGDPRPRASTPQKPVFEKSRSRLSPELKNLYEATMPAARKQAGKPLPKNASMSRYMQVSGDKVAVEITVQDDYATAKAGLEKLGFKATGAFGRVVSGVIPISALPELESAKELRFVRPAFKPVHQGKIARPAPAPAGRVLIPESNVTPIISQGDTAQRSYLVRQKHGRNKHVVDGTGVKVGVLSNSFDNLGGAFRGVLTGELPGEGNPYKYKKPVQVLKDLDSNGTDEGRAMLEIIHDVAPGAALAFHTANGGEAAMAQGILDLAKSGCQVITDDVIYLTEPFFQDGIIAQAVDRVKKKGITYFAAAGNRSIRSYESDYRATTVVPFGEEYGTAHNFSDPKATPRYFQPIFIPTDGEVFLSFQWDQPFFSAGGKGSESDLDIYLLDEDLNVVSYSAFDNIRDGDPVELLTYDNNTKSNTFYLLILKYAGPDPTRLKYIFFGDEVFYLTNPEIPGILSPTTVGHAKAEGAIATAAAFYKNTPAYGIDTPQVEFFSSKGGVPNLFDVEGNRIPARVRKKPDITAPDGGNNSFFPPFPNQDIEEDTDTYPNFFGTSAAAPHAAGVAALMIDAQKLKTISPAQIKGVLASTAIDMDDLYTDGFDKGFDFHTGPGLIKADAAVDVVRFPNRFIKDLELRVVCSEDPSNKRNWEIYNPNPFDVKATYFVAGFGGSGSIIVPPGTARFSTRTAYYYNKPAPNILFATWNDNFGFPHFDLARSTRAVCGKNTVVQDATDESAEGTALAEAMQQINTAEVYPNPSSAYFRLYLSIAEPKKIDIGLYSIDGKRLYSKVVTANGIFDIDATAYKPGVYFLKVRQGAFNKTIKLVRK